MERKEEGPKVGKKQDVAPENEKKEKRTTREVHSQFLEQTRVASCDNP